MSSRELRYAMVGGGIGSMIGEAHREGVEYSKKAKLVAACFSQSYEKTVTLGKQLGIDEKRLYHDYKELIEHEKDHPEKIDFVVVCTPNSTHYEICKAFLNIGVHVACDKPLTFEVKEAEELQKLAHDKGLLFCVTFTYTAYPSVHKIRELISKGEIGDVKFVNAEYPQEWLATPCEREGNAQAEWRLDPKRSGLVNTTGDIGSHIFSIVHTMTGLEIESLCARLNSFVAGRQLDDNVSVLVNCKGGQTGIYWACQAIIGYDNDLRVRIAGSKGTIQWSNTKNDEIEILKLNEKPQIITVPFMPESNSKFKAFSNIYQTFVNAVEKKISGQQLSATDLDFPDVALAVNAVKFVHGCYDSSQAKSSWVNI